MTSIHRVAVDILRRGAEPPRHAQQDVDPTVPLFAWGFAEAPQRAAAQLWFCAFECRCVGVAAFGRCGIRTYCAAHCPPTVQPQSRVEACPRCGGTAWTTDPRGTSCRGCGHFSSRMKLD